MFAHLVLSLDQFRSESDNLKRYRKGLKPLY